MEPFSVSLMLGFTVIFQLNYVCVLPLIVANNDKWKFILELSVDFTGCGDELWGTDSLHLILLINFWRIGSRVTQTTGLLCDRQKK